jgi:hypothetical protein
MALGIFVYTLFTLFGVSRALWNQHTHPERARPPQASRSATSKETPHYPTKEKHPPPRVPPSKDAFITVEAPVGAWSEPIYTYNRPWRASEDCPIKLMRDGHEVKEIQYPHGKEVHMPLMQELRVQSIGLTPCEFRLYFR